MDKHSMVWQLFNTLTRDRKFQLVHQPQHQPNGHQNEGENEIDKYSRTDYQDKTYSRTIWKFRTESSVLIIAYILQIAPQGTLNHCWEGAAHTRWNWVDRYCTADIILPPSLHTRTHTHTPMTIQTKRAWHNPKMLKNHNSKRTGAAPTAKKPRNETVPLRKHCRVILTSYMERTKVLLRLESCREREN